MCIHTWWGSLRYLIDPPWAAMTVLQILIMLSCRFILIAGFLAEILIPIICQQISVGFSSGLFLGQSKTLNARFCQIDLHLNRENYFSNIHNVVEMQICKLGNKIIHEYVGLYLPTLVFAWEKSLFEKCNFQHLSSDTK